MRHFHRPVRTALAFLVLAVPASGQSIVIGRAVDADSKVGIATVRIAARDRENRQEIVVMADSTGQFLLRLPAGAYVLSASRLGYSAANTREFEVADDERLEVLLQLSVNPIGLDPLVIVSTRRMSGRLADYYGRLERNTMIGRFITRAQIDSLDAPGITSHMELAGVPMVSNRRGEKWPTGTGRCRMRVFLDDVPIDGFIIDALIRPQEVEGVEIYRSAYEAPAKYSARLNTCGIILIWTRQDKRGTLNMWRGLLVAGSAITVMLLVRKAWINP